MTSPWYEDDTLTVWHGDCLDVLRGIPDSSVDSVTTDPPYNLEFMGRTWDRYDGREDTGFAYWLSGLIDGEGCFVIKAHSRGTHAPMFRLKLRADERQIITEIHRELGYGTITEHAGRAGSQPQVSWDVQDKAGCQRLVDLLDKYPLRAKKARDFAVWREAVCEWTGRPRGNRWHGGTDNARMASLRHRLMAGRRYVDPPWSGHQFQDWCRMWATECLRVLKPGGHLLAFGSPRTYHRLAAGIEDAGFEIRDSIHWIYSQGFPKSHDVSKAIDKEANARTLWDDIRVHIRRWRDHNGMTNAELNAALGLAINGSGMARHWTSEVGGQHAIPSKEMWQRLKALLGWPECDLDAAYDAVKNGADRPVIGTRRRLATGREGYGFGEDFADTAPATDAAREWQGWGTALKPAHEPILVARKPLGGSVAANVLEYGTGALNIDATRVSGEPVAAHRGTANPRVAMGDGWGDGYRAGDAVSTPPNTAGRWPANVVLGEDAAAEMDQQSGTTRSSVGKPRAGSNGTDWGMTATGAEYDDAGGASRFFPVFRYEAKAPTEERPSYVTDDGRTIAHPTCKPLAFMRWLTRLVTQPGGLVLDPFAGSGTTAEACILEGFRCVTVEQDADYLPLIKQRIDRRRNPVAYLESRGDADGTLFEETLFDVEAAG